MENIAIIEDNQTSTDELINFIQKYQEDKKQDFKIYSYKNAEDFLKNYSPIFACVFMDIELPGGMNGIKASIELRKKDKAASLVFVTSLMQYAQKGYDVDACAFLVKPVSYFDFSLKFKKALDLYMMNINLDYSINTSNGICRIAINKLMYVEVLKHRLYYHLVDSVIEVTGVLNAVEEELKPFGFLRCNKCYLVNPRFVIGIKGNEIQVGNDSLLISHPRRQQFLKDLANFYDGKIN